VSLAPGTRLGPYEIVGGIGAGGMGEVYKARDTRLDRSVAIKILSPDISSSPEARQRFQREARTISQLPHPHICALFDVGEAPNPEPGALNSEPVAFLVMELLEGETLAARLAKGALPLEQTLRYGAQIADALDKAHRQGIVHRDLKPANVMITKAGVKLLDFGLAKAAAPLLPPSMSAGTMAAAPLTGQGMMAGTVQYMAPEVLEGRPADARSDLYALGAVLYEMATGQKTFRAVLRPLAPPALDRLVRTCLATNPDDRYQSAHDVGLQLAAIAADDKADASADRTGATRWIPWAIAAIAVLSAVAIGTLRSVRVPAAPEVPTSIRFSLLPPSAGAFAGGFETTGLALSPDGSQLAFAASDRPGGRRIWMRHVSALDARPLTGTEGASSPFWSPDGRSIAFFIGDKLKRLDLLSGSPVSVCTVREGIGFFGTWGADGGILFASIEGEAIFRVNVSGGVPVETLKPDRSRGEARTNWPWFLPDGRRFLYFVRLKDGSGRLMLAETGHPPREVLSVVSNVQYVEPGYLVFGRDGALVGQRFDASSGKVAGDPFSIADPVAYFSSTAMGRFTTSKNGSLVFQSHDDQHRLVWFNRAGREMGTVAGPGHYQDVRISPDGRRVSFDRLQAGGFDLWEADLERGFETRLTTDPSSDVAGTWTPDGRTLFFAADRGGPPHLFRRDLTTGVEEEVLPAGTMHGPQDVSPDGRTLILGQRAPGGGDIWTLPLTGGSRTPSPLIQSPFDEEHVRFSPDGRFFSFASNASGRVEVYVAPFPATGERIRVSVGGGDLPRWSRDGRELFYVSDDRHLVDVPIRTTPTLQIGKPAPLFPLSGQRSWLDFDLSIDGQRFLAVVPEIAANEQPLTVVLHWTADLHR
jgi:eukaryotic-like serine/threonine-protein kinase